MSQEHAIPESDVREIIAATVWQIPGPLGITVASSRICLRLIEPVVGLALTAELKVLLANALTVKHTIVSVLSTGAARLGFKKFPHCSTSEVPSDAFHICRAGFIYLNVNFDNLPPSAFKRAWSLDKVREATGRYDALLTKYEEDLDQGQAEVSALDLKDADKLVNVIMNGILGDEVHGRLAAEYEWVRAILTEYFGIANTDLTKLTLQ